MTDNQQDGENTSDSPSSGPSGEHGRHEGSTPQYGSAQDGSAQYGSSAQGSGQYGSDDTARHGSSGTGQDSSSQYGSQPSYGQYGSGQYGSGQYGSGQQYGSGRQDPGQQYGSDGSFTQPYGQSYSGNPYGGAQQYGQTQPFGSSPYGQSSPSYYPATTTQPRRGGSRAGLVAGVIVLTALAGGIGGVVGAGLEDSSTRSLSSPLGGDRDTSQPVQGAQGSVQEVAAKVLPSVVSIDVRVGNREGEGSGVVLSQDGFILTNNHVVTAESGRSGQLTVSYNDGSTSGASVVGADPISDIAVIKADKTGLTPITVGTSANLAVGQNVIAVGSPLGLAGTVTTGIISSLNRPVSTQGENDSTASVIDAIQTDAAINPGNSGGALVNGNGALIGINTAIASLSDSSSQQGGSIGLGFAIPIDQAMRIAQELQRTGRATQAGLGVSVQSSGENAATPGALISAVQAGGAASKAGIPTGALITKVNDRVISSGDALVAAIRSHAPGDTVSITYTANGSSRTVQVTLDTLDTGGR
ncbi:trypsin-like peptidase domain-containing protein [Williamsia serinedens]|uniref:Serine protease PepD n=1 Tax=Williamsia serinedens TaxID=391736 RepID=A0ABT1H030_9NOCA|nr:trypsin-like peptidase domain-containing protein [Williamsia serinedens]MCP2160604.1 putative serine protease PepD [Williamsia serinedens]